MDKWPGRQNGGNGAKQNIEKRMKKKKMKTTLETSETKVNAPTFEL